MGADQDTALGILTVTEGRDVLVAAVDSAVVATLAAAEIHDIQVSHATVVSGVTIAATESGDTQVASVVFASPASIVVTEGHDIQVAPAVTVYGMIAVTDHRDTAIMTATGGGGVVFPPTRTPKGVCRWFPQLRPRVRRAGVRI